MSCLSEEQLLVYLDNEGSREEMEKIQFHLNQCSDCTKLFEELGQETALLREVSDISSNLPPLDDSFVIATMTQIKQRPVPIQMKQPKRNKKRKGWKVFAAAAAGLMIAVGIGAFASPTFASYISAPISQAIQKWFPFTQDALDQVEHKENFQVTDQGLTLSVKDIIVDKNQAFVVYSILDAKGKPTALRIPFAPAGDRLVTRMKLVDTSGKILDYTSISDSGTIGKEAYFKIDPLPPSLPNHFSLQLKIEKLGKLKGNWSLTIPIDYQKAKRAVQEYPLQQKAVTNGVQIELKHLIYSPLDTRLMFNTELTESEKQKIDQIYPKMDQYRRLQFRASDPILFYRIINEENELIAYEAMSRVKSNETDLHLPGRENPKSPIINMDWQQTKGRNHFSLIYQRFPVTKKLFFVLDGMVKTVPVKEDIILDFTRPQSTTQVQNNIITVKTFKLEKDYPASKKPPNARIELTVESRSNPIWPAYAKDVFVVAIDETGKIYKAYLEKGKDKQGKTYKLVLGDLYHKPKQLTLKATTQEFIKIDDVKFELPPFQNNK